MDKYSITAVHIAQTRNVDKFRLCAVINVLYDIYMTICWPYFVSFFSFFQNRCVCVSARNTQYE